jgi:phosphotransferase system HPr (HPr) family protein
MNRTNQQTIEKVHLVVSNEDGLHAKAAAMLILANKKFEAQLSLECGGRQTDARSFLGILSLEAEKGAAVTAIAEGPDAHEAIQAVSALFACGFNPHGFRT